MVKPNVIFESIPVKVEGRHIEGILAIPRISRKGNLYLPEELAKADGQRVPILWDHNGTAMTERDLPIKQKDIIGYSTLKWDSTLMQLRYEGDVNRDLPPGPLFTSLGALPSSRPDHVCGDRACYEIPKGLRFTEMSITPNPGMPETTVNITENFKPKDCGCKGKKAKTERMDNGFYDVTDGDDDAAGDIDQAKDADGDDGEPDGNTVDECVEALVRAGLSKSDAIHRCQEVQAEAAYPWDQCIRDQTSKGYSADEAKKICGSIKAANESLFFQHFGKKGGKRQPDGDNGKENLPDSKPVTYNVHL